MKPKLSIIIPIYNSERYLKDCLESILCNNISPEDSYEIICINDGSTDKSQEILIEYATKYKNLVVIHKQNEGVSVARNIGIDTSSGDYIWFVDSDDMINKNCLSILFELIKKYSAEIYNIKIEKDFDIFTNSDYKSLAITKKNPDDSHGLFRGVSCNIFRRDLIENLRFAYNMYYAEDLCFILEAFLLLKKGWIEIAQSFYYYRQHADSTMYMPLIKCGEKRYISALAMAQKCKDIIENNHPKKQTAQNFLVVYQHEVLKYLPFCYLSLNSEMKMLKNKKIFPAPILWNEIDKCFSIKSKLIKLLRYLFFRFYFLYNIYYYIIRKKYKVGKI